MMAKTLTLESRITAALTSGTSTSIAELLPEVQAAATTATTKAETARQAALDPLLEPEKIAETRKASDDVRFEADRLTAAADRLREALAAAQEAERTAALEATGKEAHMLNAKLSETLGAFEKAAAELAGHAATITEQRAQIAELNTALREGGRGDLVSIDPIKQRAREADRLIADPLRGLYVEGHWPRHPNFVEALKASSLAAAGQ
jgi:chromosome segregation ATPase